MTNIQIPDDSVLKRSADRIEGRVAEHIAQHPRRRVLVTTLGGAGVLAVGVLLGAAAVPNIAHPGHGTSVDAHGRVIPADFYIGCFASETDVNASYTLSAATGQGQRNRSDPTAFCSSQSRQLALTGDLETEISKLESAGQSCGYIQVADGHRWAWKVDRDAGTLALSDGIPINWPTECEARTTLKVTASSQVSLVACALADNWAGVYPLTAGTAGQLCGRLGLSVWPGSTSR